MVKRVMVIGFYDGPMRIRGRLVEHLPLVVGLRFGTEDEITTLEERIRRNVRRHNDWLNGVPPEDVKRYIRVIVYDAERTDRYGFPRWLGPADDWKEG